MPSLSIIIVTWNGKEYAKECLDSLQSCCLGLNVETIVVDNASSDGTPDLIKQEFPTVRLIANSSNLGFAKANNIGIRLSRGPYVCLVNSDVKVRPGCVRQMVAYMEAHPQVGLLGPQMFDRNGYLGRSYMRFPTVWRSLCGALALHSILPASRWFSGIMMTDFDNQRTSEVEVLNGWFLMVRRKALDEVGLLDERFFIYGEDIDWSYRFHCSQWQKIYLAETGSLHYGGASSSADPTRFQVEMQRANLQFWRKYHGRISTAVYQGTVWLHQVVRVIGYSAAYIAGGFSRREYGRKARRSLSCLLRSLDHSWPSASTSATGDRSSDVALGTGCVSTASTVRPGTREE